MFQSRYTAVWKSLHLHLSISTKIPRETSMVESYLRTFQGLTGGFSCYLEQLYCGEQVSTCFCRNISTWDIISGVLEMRYTVQFAGLLINMLKRDSIRDHFLKILSNFQRTFNKFCKMRLKGDFAEFLGELLFETVSGKLPPGKFPPIKLPPWKFPPSKLQPGTFLPEFLNHVSKKL